jgi:hypothetical protein
VAYVFAAVSRMILVASLLLATACAGGCIGPYKASVVDARGVGGLTPTVEDPDVGLVGAARGFDLRLYTVFAVARFDVNEADVKDDQDRSLATAMPDYFQSEIVRRVRAAGIFERVVNLSEREYAPGAERALRLEGTITRLVPGNRALRYLVGFGAGAAKAQAETRFVDVQTGQVLLVTADRREAAFGIFGGDSEEHLQESFSDMARDLAKYLVRIRGQGAARSTAAAPGGATAVTAAARTLAGTWQGTLGTGRRVLSGPIILPVTLRIVEDGDGLRWILLRGGSEIGRGGVETAGDGVRLSGTYDQDAAPGPPRVKVTYSGGVAGEAFDATGVTEDRHVQTLSLRRVGQ